MELITKIVKFVLGWVIFFTILIISLFFGLLAWNWKETQTMNMEKIIKEICGKSTWKTMTFNKL